MSAAAPQNLDELLQGVSRSFYWSLRLLPGTVRPAMSLAYLLARATDTVADTGVVPVEQRLEALEDLRQRIAGQRAEAVAFAALVDHQGSPAERVLLEKVESLISILAELPAADRQLIRGVLDIITSGQALDVRLSAAATASAPVKALASRAELEDYTWRVAGCVGEFWTRLCVAHLRPAPALAEAELIRLGMHFGQGLQLVNILRDLPRDLQQGRCYLPADALQQANLLPGDLLDPRVEPRFRPVYDAWVDQARAWLGDGWAYTVALPRSWWRVRLACALPVLIGIKTLAKLRINAILPPDSRIKVTRRELRGIVWRALLCYPWPNKWNQLPASPFFQTP